MSALPSLDVRVRPVSQLISSPVTWLWPFRLGQGKLAMLDGDPGLGKSLVALDLCARLSTGQPFPDSSPCPGPANCLILNGEDGAADTIRPRLEALGADLSRVFVLHQGESGLGPALRLPGQLAALDAALAQTQARLLVLDPVVSFLDRHVLSANDASVRLALFPLAELAARHGCAGLLNRHLNKDGGSRALYRGGGSIAFVAACRSAWLLAADPHQPKRRILAQVKNNLAAVQPSLVCVPEPQENGPPRLTWLGPSPLTADELLAAAGRHRRSVAQDHAGDFLAAFLEGGPRTSREVWTAAEEAGLSKRTLDRAKGQLQIRSIRVCLDGVAHWYWLLPHQELPATIPPEAAPPNLEPWLRPLREKYPPSTPLDGP
jgi:hypothetical protein